MIARSVLALALMAAPACSGEPEPPAASNVARAQLAAAAAPVPSGTPAPSTGPCEITGESRDIDPAGLRVRQEPSLSSQTIGRLHPGMDPEVFFHEANATLAEGAIGARFTIVRVSGDWLRIAEIDPLTDGIDPSGDTETNTPNFQGTGWVHASRVRLIPADNAVARERPEGGAPAIDRTALSNPDDPRLRIIGCRGRWAEVQARPDCPGQRGVRAWLLSRPNTDHAAIMRAALERADAAR